jgi:superfamily II DNA/RNA helicase
LTELIFIGLDVKGHAETGSGKSAAFLLPIINIVIQKKRSGEYKPKRSYPFAVILEPTRELAYQLYDQARKLAEGMVYYKFSNRHARYSEF